RLASLGLPVADLTCGIGGDLAAVAARGARTIGIERERATALLAAANVSRATLLQADARFPPVDLGRFAIILDPSRRQEGRRRFDPAAFSPAWDEALSLVAQAPAGVLKAPPGIDAAHIPPQAEVEFVQYGRSLREAALWFGAGAVPGLRRAVLMPIGAELDSTAPQAPDAPVPPGPYLFDPESCVTRAGLVLHLAHRLGARLLDPSVAYLTGPGPAADPLCATFALLDAVPFSVARLKARLKEGQWRADEIRRRAFPIEPDELRALLGRPDGDPVTLLCTTIAGKRVVFIARRLP
ncbi:MAG: THUMP-like domain-containing protein, partial [Tepidiformaceae bacterium]